MTRANAKPYDVLAKYYRQILYYVDYDKWFSYLRQIAKRHRIDYTKTVDISCGMGIYAHRLLDEGIDAYGSDISEAFIREAKKAGGKERAKRFRVYDMRAPGWKGPFTHAASLHDSVNYLRTEKDLQALFSKTAGMLSENGTFLFDVSTEQNILNHFDDAVISEDLGETIFFWKTTYDRKKSVVLSKMEFLEKQPNGKWTMTQETHTQRIWEQEDLERIARPWFTVEGAYGDFTKRPPEKRSEGITFVLRKK